MPNQSLRHRGAKKTKISIDTLMHFKLKHALLRGVNRVKVKNRKKSKKVLTRFWRFS
jgi:hypothetical protein